MKELLKLSTILGIICCAAALALGCVYELTKEPIARQQQLKKQRAVAAVFPNLPLGNGVEGTAMQLCDDHSAASCRGIFLITAGERICGIGLETLAFGYGGPIDLMIGLLPDGSLSAISIISHSETPGLGANITQESFNAQFSGLSGDATTWDFKKTAGNLIRLPAQPSRLRRYSGPCRSGSAFSTPTVHAY
jgi:Na+-translocating ferredoxin:NAD+ oxidoreductase subunit G